MRTERNIDSHPVPFLDKLLLQIAPNSVELAPVMPARLRAACQGVPRALASNCPALLFIDLSRGLDGQCIVQNALQKGLVPDLRQVLAEGA